MPSDYGFAIDFEFSDSDNKVQEIVIKIPEENLYFKMSHSDRLLENRGH